MNENVSKALAASGIDVEDAMDRMDNDEELFKSLALKYLQNTNFVALEAAMESKDYEAAYTAAHTLKGVSGNLSFSSLYKDAAAITEALKQGEINAAEAMLPDVKKAHQAVINCLVKWEAGDL